MGKIPNGLYKARHLVENFFAKLKQYRALATRYDKRSANFLSGSISYMVSVAPLEQHNCPRMSSVLIDDTP